MSAKKLQSANPKRIQIENIGQIKSADVTFGDLTVFVGPQATGKSIFLQLLKLIIDKRYIHAEFERFNYDWKNKLDLFLDLYFGQGMSSLQTEESKIVVDSKKVVFSSLARLWHDNVSKEGPSEHLFFIPAQRVMSIRDGQTRPFMQYQSGDPFALREFGEKLHGLLQREFGREDDIFPKVKRLKPALRKQIHEHIFRNFNLSTTSETDSQKRIVLRAGKSGKPLPYLVWSAGQREFVPLLLGLYWLMPSGALSLRDELNWVVIEEPEMGLHPNAISVTMALVLELIRRGYKVCLSTHSPHVLDVMWGLQFLKKNGGKEQDVLDMFQLPSDPGTKEIATTVLAKTYKTYYFAEDGQVRDISNLDPGAEDSAESGWGGLSGFSGNVASIVSRVAERHESGK